MSFLERVDQSIRRSAVWRSLFRNPYPRDERSRAYAVMNNVFLHIHPVRVRQHAVKFAYTFCLGGLSFFLFLVLTITGVYLMFFYVPSATLEEPSRDWAAAAATSFLIAGLTDEGPSSFMGVPPEPQ